MSKSADIKPKRLYLLKAERIRGVSSTPPKKTKKQEKERKKEKKNLSRQSSLLPLTKSRNFLHYEKPFPPSCSCSLYILL